MALDRELRRLLECARLPKRDKSSSKDGELARPTTREILDRLIAIQQQTCVPFRNCSTDMNLAELLVLTAEAAIFQADFETALKSIEWFFSECRLKNQFYCRAQFVRAHCGSHDAQSNTGVMKLKKVLNAIHFILAVLPVAADNRPTYNFLVYNASVTYWHIARQLMKQSTFQFLLPSLSKLIDALKLTAEADIAWLFRLQIALVYAQVDANQLANAAKTINDLVDVQITPRLVESLQVEDSSLTPLYEEALRIQIHIGSFKDSECQKIVSTVKRLLPSSNKRSSLLVKLQCIKSNNLSGTLEAAYVELFREATSFVAFTCETTVDEVKTFMGSLEPRMVEAIDAEVMVETAIHASFHSVLSIAAACDTVLQHKGKHMPPKVRVLCQVLSAILLIIMPSTSTGSKTSSRQRQSMLLARRVEGMKAMERALLASKRQHDPDLIEQICLYAWNLSLPLLQPHLRHQVAKAFDLASSALEELDSLLLGLRARLYLEIAKLEVASDFLAKANANMNKALSLDYGVIPLNTSAAIKVDSLSVYEDWITRPVDTHLYPIKHKLALRLAANDLSSNSTEVLAMLEQIRQDRNSQQQRTSLAYCIDLMTETSSASESLVAVENVRLWSEISSFAWNTLHDGELAQKAVKSAMMTCFSSSETGKVAVPKNVSEQNMLMLFEVDMCLLLVEVLATKLKDLALKADQARCQAEYPIDQTSGRSAGKPASTTDLAPFVFLRKEAFVLGMNWSCDIETEALLKESAARTESDEDGVVHALQDTITTKQLEAMKSEILGYLIRALNTAKKIGWTFVLENTCIYLWNYHFHIFCMLLGTSEISTRASTNEFDPQWILPECLSAFEAAYAALEAVPSRVDNDLLANVALGLSSIYEKSGRFDKALIIADTFLKRKTLATPASAYVASNCKGVSVLHLKSFAELKSRVQIAQNAKTVTPTDSTSSQVKVIAYLEAMEVTFKHMLLPTAQRSQLLEKAQGFYQKAISLWQTNASEMFNAFMSDEIDNTLEEAQQLMELYVEIWVRIGCGAFRLNNTKYAIECAELALVVRRPNESKKAKQMTQQLIVESTWKWFALAELLYGRAILALTPEDTRNLTLCLASLEHLMRAVKYGLRGRIPTFVIRACKVVWNATIPTMNHGQSIVNEPEESNFFDRVVATLRKTLASLDRVTALNEADLSFYGELVLLTLAVCEKANKWTEQFEICEAVLKSVGPTSGRGPLSREAMKEIQTALAISGTRLGKPISLPRSGRGTKSLNQLQESLVQAQILKKVAFASWKDPPAQLKALSSAYVELDGQREEQALVLVDMAEWMLTHQFSVKDADAYLECAISTLLNCQSQKEELSQVALSHKPSSEQLSVASRQAATTVYSPLWFAEKHLRLFVMRAMLSTTCTERSKYVRLAQYQVKQAWEYLILMRNEVDDKAAFDRENASGDNEGSSCGFDEWKKAKGLKFTKPVSDYDWIDLLLGHDEDVANRFYLSWTKLLQAIQLPDTAHITQPVLTLSYLEELLTMLRDDGLQYSSMVPAFCLYSVVFHAYVADQARIAHIWLELSQFDLMEHLSMSNFSIPLQSALDLLQSHRATLMKDLQVEGPRKQFESAPGSRNRRILPSTHLDTWDKTAATIHLLLQFGYVRQGKDLLQILQCSVETSTSASKDAAVISECALLSSYVLELEGQSKRALAQVESVLENPRVRVDICRYLEWTLRCCELTCDLDRSLSILKAAEKQAASTCVAGMKRSSVQTLVGSTAHAAVNPSDASATSNAPDLVVVILMARIAFQQALTLLKKAGVSYGASVLSHLQASKRVLDKAMQMLSLINAHYACSQELHKYSQTLQSFELKFGSSTLSSAGLDAKVMVQQCLALEEICLEQHFRFPTASVSPQQAMAVSPLRLKVAMTKLRLARLVMASELSCSAIQETEMTWYRHYEDTQRSVVEKWLDATESHVKEKSELPRAMTLITCAIEMLRDHATVERQHAIAQVLRLQCQRLRFTHGDDREQASAIQSHLWTHYTSSNARHATWVCSHGTQAALAADTTNDIEVQDDDQQQDKGVDANCLEEMLALHTAQLQKYQRIAYEKQSVELLELCSNELIQVLGCRRAFDCAKNVLEHQSAEMIKVASKLFDKCSLESNVQRLHLERIKKLQKTHLSATTHSLPFQLSQLYLSQQSELLTRMSVGTCVDTIVAALPSSLRVLCLHFSPDRCFLYAALLSSSDNDAAMARMEFTAVQTALLGQLQQRIHAWRMKCATQTVAYEEVHGQDESYEFVSEEKLSSSDSDREDGDEDVLEAEFSLIISDTVELLDPLFTHSAMEAELQSHLAGNTLILLLDRMLACLPMEALPALQSADAIARDFSIQMLHQRLMAMKKQPLRSKEMRVIVDPHKEDPGNSSGETITSVMKQKAEGWKSAVEHGQIPSVTDWQQALISHRGGGLMYVGPDRVLGSSLPLQQIVGMNVALTCQVMILLDHAENAASARRQSKFSSDKLAWEKEVQGDPYARALLLTLSGVNIAVINQWVTTFSSNRRLARGLLENISKNCSIGNALKTFSETEALAPATTTMLAVDAATTDPIEARSSADGATDGKLLLKNRFRYNCVVYGLAHSTLESVV